MPACRSGITYTNVFVLYDIPHFYHNSSITSNKKSHYPATDSLVLSLQSGKAAAAWVTCKRRDSLARVWICGSRWLNFIYITLLRPRYSFTASAMGNPYVPAFYRFKNFFLQYQVLQYSYNVVFLYLFLGFEAHFSSQERRVWHTSKLPPPWNTLSACMREHKVNLGRFHQLLPPRQFQ